MLLFCYLLWQMNYTNCHLNQHQFLILQVCRSVVQERYHRLKSRYQQVWIFFWRLWKNLFPCLFKVLEAFLGSCPPYSVFNDSSIIYFWSVLVVTSLWLTRAWKASPYLWTHVITLDSPRPPLPQIFYVNATNLNVICEVLYYHIPTLQ